MAIAQLNRWEPFERAIHRASSHACGREGTHRYREGFHRSPDPLAAHEPVSDGASFFEASSVEAAAMEAATSSIMGGHAVANHQPGGINATTRTSPTNETTAMRIMARHLWSSSPSAGIWDAPSPCAALSFIGDSVAAALARISRSCASRILRSSRRRRREITSRTP